MSCTTPPPETMFRMPDASAASAQTRPLPLPTQINDSVHPSYHTIEAIRREEATGVVAAAAATQKLPLSRTPQPLAKETAPAETLLEAIDIEIASIFSLQFSHFSTKQKVRLLEQSCSEQAETRVAATICRKTRPRGRRSYSGFSTSVQSICRPRWQL